MENCFKIDDLVIKLKNLKCPLLRNGDDAWVSELLLKPSFERHNLIEWILSKLGFHIQKIHDHQTTEGKVKNLLVTVSALGICSKDNADIIQGTASIKTQIEFWKALINVLFKKTSLQSCQDEAYFSVSSDSDCQTVSDLCNRQYEIMRKIFESVNLINLFKEKVQLFPPYLQKEVKEALKSPCIEISSLQNLKEINGEEIGMQDQSIENVLENELYLAEHYDSVDSLSGILNDTEENIDASLKDLKEYTHNDFSSLYGNLKPYLFDATPEELLNIGPAFKDSSSKLQSLLELKKSLILMKMSDSELRDMNHDIMKFRIPSAFMSDAVLSNYINILQEQI